MASGDLPHNFTLSAAELRGLDRPHPIRDLDRGDPILLERHISARDQERRGAGHPRGGDRRTPPRPGGDGDAGGCGRDAGRSSFRARQCIELRKLVEESEDEIADLAERDKNPFCRRRGGADLKADRRHVPRLRPSDPFQQRQGPRGQMQRVCRSGGPGVDDLDREEPRGEARDRTGPMAEPRRYRRRAPRTVPRSRRSRRRYLASPLEIGFNSRYLLDITEQIDGEGAQFVMSDAGLADNRARQRRSERPLRSDADAGLSIGVGRTDLAQVDKRGRQPHIILMFTEAQEARRSAGAAAVHWATGGSA